MDPAAGRAMRQRPVPSPAIPGCDPRDAALFRESPALSESILAYQQNHRTNEDYERDAALPWDGMAEQWYASLDAFYAGAGGAPFSEIIAPDEEKFMDRLATRFILCSPPRVVLGADGRG